MRDLGDSYFAASAGEQLSKAWQIYKEGPVVGSRDIFPDLSKQRSITHFRYVGSACWLRPMHVFDRLRVCRVRDRAFPLGFSIPHFVESLNSSCTYSPPGMGNAAPSMSGCDACPKGSQQDGDRDLGIRRRCDPGTYCRSIGASSCQLCGQGVYANTAGPRERHLCPRGQFQNVDGQSLCASCDRGFFI